MVIILGTQYSGEMRYSIERILNYALAKAGCLPLRSACLVDERKRSTLIAGPRGSGKSSLSVRQGPFKMVGNHFHFWAKDSVFTAENGCFINCSGLKMHEHKEVYSALKFGSLVENGILSRNREINFDKQSLS